MFGFNKKKNLFCFSSPPTLCILQTPPKQTFNHESYEPQIRKVNTVNMYGCSMQIKKLTHFNDLKPKLQHENRCSDLPTNPFKS